LCVALYQDILTYARKQRDQGAFKFSHVGSWLINENIEFRSYYTDSKAHVPKSARLANKRQRIQGCIDNLVQWDLLRVIGKVKAEKNELDTQLFESTLEGNLLSYLFEVNSTTDGNSDVAIKSILDLVESLAKKIDSSILNFVFEFFKRCNDKKYFGSIISHFMRIVLPRSRTNNGKELMVLFFGLKNIINWVLADEEAFWGVLNNLSGRNRKIVFFHLKMEIENYYSQNFFTKEWIVHRANNFDVAFHTVIDRGDNFSRAVGIPTDYWEETRIERGDDYEDAIVPSICEKCKRDTAFAVKITKYLESLVCAYRPYPSGVISGDCLRCGEKFSVGVHVMTLPNSISLRLSTRFPTS
jgi:hypothetical protein